MSLFPGQVIVLATPVFLLLIALAYAWGVGRGRNDTGKSIPPPVAAFAAVQLVALLGGVAWLLWHANGLAPRSAAVWLAALCAGLWAVGALLQGRLTVLEVLLVEAGALATATAVQGPVELHHLFKPLAMLLAIAFVLRRAIASPRSRALLLAALAGSLAGDVLLMFEAWFVPGLACFLLVHLCYLALLRQDVGWFPSRGALAATLTVGALMYVFLFPRLDPVLKVAVAGYIVAIALMAAQAIGRAVVLRDGGATGVAAGALLFMVSDSLLAIHLFATPLPLAQFWVLGLYYAAQLLIARNAAPARRDAAVQPENNSPALLGGTTPR